MSLLMQALKKAENAKQKQGQQADASAAATAAAAPELPAAIPESMSLTLQPQELSADEQAQLASATTQEMSSNTTSAADYFSAAAEPITTVKTPTLAEQQAALEADSGLTPKPTAAFSTAAGSMGSTGETHPDSENTPANAPYPTHRDKNIPVGGGTQGKLKIGLDERQSAAIEAKKKLAARNAAKSVFDAKQKTSKSKTVIIALLGLIILCGAGAYAYITLIDPNKSPYANVAAAPQANIQPETDVLPVIATDTPTDVMPTNPSDADPSAVNNPDAALAASAPIDTNAAIASTNATLAAPKPLLLPTTPTSETRQAMASNSVPISAPAAFSTPPSAPTFAPATTLPSAQPPLAAMTKQSDAIQIRHTAATKQLNPHLSDAYQSYVAGDLMSAAAQYKKVLRQEPNNRDALLGIATIAIRRGQNAEAGSFYSRLLELNPNDTDASAGLASLDYNDPSKAESRLKNSLARSPDSSTTLFALGNIYAEQSRWSEAQQSYFRAFGIAPENADYAYNLAISLDRLDQPKLALEYYQRALQLAQKNGGNLDKNMMLNRIHALQSMP